MSEVQPVNIAKKEEKLEDEDDEKHSRPLSWRVKRPLIPSAPTLLGTRSDRIKAKPRQVRVRVQLLVVILLGEHKRNC